MKRIKLAAICLSLTLGSQTHAQEMINPTDALDIAVAIRDLGYKATLEKDSVGDPIIRSKAAGINFSILFYDCTDNRDCESLQFSAGFNLADGTSTQSMNEWNRAKRYGKAHIDDENDPFLRYDFNFGGAGAGISMTTFEENFEIWESLLNDFKEHIDW